MRPLKLTITGFGPYRDRTVIDMDSLGKGGLYLVTGDTGAGKTFIFDALTFALYGEMSGGSRDSRNVRSQYAEASTPTETELVFEYRGKTYTVKRNPEYTRPRKRGEGFTTESANAELHFPDGSVIDGAAKVTAAVKDILGIDRGQFCSIVMIAQGEFRRVLNASTDERQLLFRKLFDTEPYNRLADELKRKSREVSASFDEKKKEIGMAFAGVSCGFDEELAAELEAAKEQSGLGSDDMIAVLERLMDRGLMIEKETRESLERTETGLTAAQVKAAAIETIKENAEKLAAARADQKTLAESVKTARAALDEANAAKPETEKLKSDLTLLGGSMESYDRLDSINKELEDAKAAAGSRHELLDKAEVSRTGLREKLDKLKNEAESLKNSGEDLIRIRGEAERKSNRAEALKSLISDIGKVNEIRRELSVKQEELIPLIERADALDAEYSEASSSYLREQAGILAGRLADGVPCPVCGSLSHPHPAKLSEDAPSAQDVEEKDRLAKEARQKAADKSGEAQTIKGNLEAIESRASEAALKETGTDELETALKLAGDELAELGAALESLKAEETKAAKDSERAATLSAETAEAQKKYEAAVKETDDLGRETAMLGETVKGIEKRLEDTAKGLAFGSRSEAESRIKELEAEIKKKNDAIEKAASDHISAESDLKACSARIEELERMTTGYDPQEEERVRDEIERAKAEKASLNRTIVDIASDISSFRSAISVIKSGAAGLEEIRKDHEMIDALARTASGSLAGKDRITLEAFVQTMYFDRVIRRANLRLRLISDGQYEFVRGTGPRDKRSHNGLDLAVVDHYSGSERPVSTLSGGESFMASLSLALGLSDEVQASAGGIRLDTMFVDEGFGSLDSETLEKAIRTLTELSDEGTLVGIISHVDALKTRIDKQIVVTKTRGNGSRVDIVS